ncbi:hypothetical protein GDO78_004700 [Eleutherodactylus coqui]|uniref:Opioid growth factor receptor (OGFr) conserved domain-containing protein n=1 Tax=Eleutherodactylus coqui TaxID=57060 RepID=A0A8J6ET87_ELECQ|nr:hypothetical protein GDO78_004700 [Eleutherodactylus coqui]
MSRDGGEDGWTSEYDSTWEDEEEDGRKEERPREQRPQRRHNCPRRWKTKAARDLQRYRHSYQEEQSGDQSCTGEHPKTTPNLDFYQNKKCFEPNGLCIDDLLNDWKEDYTTLERNHSYIQWLFPLREYGMNSCAKPLTLSEVKMMKGDEAVMARFLKAYKLMLQFYGIKLLSEETGEVERAANWEDRFKNLNYHSHNNLRITRILKCLGEMGYSHFQAPLVRFFLEETLSRDKLGNVKRSVLDYFMFAVKDKHERRKLVHFAWKNYKPNNHQDRFIWGPVDKLKLFHPCEENDVNVGSEALRDDAGKNPDSKIYKNQGRKFINVHDSDTARSEVTASQHGTKMEKANAAESIPMKDRGALTHNSPNHNTEASPNQSTPFSNDDSITALEENVEENGAKNEGIDDYDDTREDSSKEKVQKEEVKKIVHDREGAIEVNGLSNSGDIQNIEKTCHPGESHRKRKMLVRSPLSPSADGGGAGDSAQPNPCQAEDEGGQIDRVEDKVKKLKLVERPTRDYPNGIEEDNDPDDADPRGFGDHTLLPNVESNLKGHCEDLRIDE